MAQPLLAPPPPQTDPWASEFQMDPPSDPWAQEFQMDAGPSAAQAEDPWAKEFTMDAAPAADPWAQEFQMDGQQSPLETGLRTIAQDLGSLAMTGVSGLGRYFEDLSGVANQVVPGLGDVLDYAPQSALFQALAPVAEDLRQETETVYNPDAQRNPIAATVGGGIGQALGMVPMIATGGTPLVLGAAAASGYGQGSQTAEDLGVQNPAGRMALGAGFGAAETLVERLGGIGAGPVRAGAQQIVESLGKSTLKTIGSEAIEEPVTGVLQDAGSALAAKAVEDPNRPGFTITGQPIAPLLPNSPEYWKSRGMEAIGGAAGGTVFAGLGALGRLTQRPDQTATPTIEGNLPGTPTTPTATAPTEAQVIANGTTYAYDTTQLTADQIQTLAATGSLQEYIDQGMVRNVFAPPPLPTAADARFMPPPNLTSGLTDLGTIEGDLLTDARFRPPPQAQAPAANVDLLAGTNLARATPAELAPLGTDQDVAAAEARLAAAQDGREQRLAQADLAAARSGVGPVAQALNSARRSAADLAIANREPVAAEAMDIYARTPINALDAAGNMQMQGMPAGYVQRGDQFVFEEAAAPTVNESLTPQDEAQTAQADAVIAQESQARGIRPPTPGTVSRQGSALPFEEIVGMAAAAIRNGVTNFSAWATAMVRRFGEGVRRYLAQAWQSAKKNSQVGALDIGGSVSTQNENAPERIEAINQLIGVSWNATETEKQQAQASAELLLDQPKASLKFVRAGNSKVFQKRDGSYVKISFAANETMMNDIIRQLDFLQGSPFAVLPKIEILHTAGVYSMTQTNAGIEGVELRKKTQQEFGADAFTANDRKLFQQLKQQNPLSADTNLAALRVETDTDLKNIALRIDPDGKVRTAAFDFDGISEEIMAAEGMQAAQVLRTTPPMEGIELKQFSAPVQQVLKQNAKGIIGPSQAARTEGFTNTTVVAMRPNGSTVIFSELANLAGQGIRAGLTLAQWTASMVQRFGAAVRQYLAEAWQSAKKNSQVGARANLNPNARLSAREPTFAEALEGQTRQSQFGERVQADDRLTDPLRAAPVSTYAIQGQQQALDQANAIIRQLGLEGATATFNNDATLPMPVRIAGLMQAALQYDARAALALRQGNEAGSAAADAATEAAIQAKASLEFIGNETGRNLAMFNTWARMSPDGQLRRLDRNLAKAARDTIRGDTGVTPAEVTDLVNEETANLDLDAILEEVLTEGNTPRPVNLQTGAPIARNGTIIDRLLGGLETTARAISESTTIQRAVEAIDNVLKALSGKLFADPLLLTPIGQAVLRTTRTLLLQGTKISQAIADAIAVVRTRTPIPQQDVAPLTQAVTSAVVKEVIRPILRKLAFDPNYNKREATKDMLAIGIGVMEAGRLADAIIAKRPKIAKTAQDIVRQRVMRRLSDKPRSKSRKQKLPAIIDTLVLAAGAGFINERSFLDAWDKKHPLPKLTPADRVRLRQMAAAINILPEGILRQAEAIKFQNEVALIEGIAAVDAITAAWYANLLAGLSTQGVNIWGNGLNLFFRSLAVGLASPSDVTKLFSGLAAGVRPGLREAKQVLKTGQLLKVNKMDDMQVSGTLELMATQGGPKGFGQWLAYVMSIGGLTRYVFRAMGAMDAVFWYSAQEGMAHLAASRTLRKAGGLKPGTQQFNAEFIRQLGGDETQYLADLDQARTELKAAGVPVTPAAVNRRAWEIRQQRRSLDIRDASVRWADRNVMQQQPEGIGRAITGIITILQKVKPAGVPIFVPLVPFNRILSNLFESSLDWAGIGILRGIVGSHLTDMTNKDRRLFDTVERRERFMAGMLGMGIAGTLLAAAMALKDMDDDEVPFMVYAMGPPDPTGRGTMPKGWRPYSIKINGQYVSFAESPMGPLLGAVGAWMDSTRYGKTENKTLVDRGLIAFHNALNSFMSMGVLSSIKDIVELWSGQGGARSLKQAALSPVAGFVPAQGFLRDMAPLFDNTKISDADVFGALVKDIPVLKSYGRPALNVLGEPVKIEGIPVVRRFATGQRPDANISFIQKHQLRISALERTIDIGDYLPKRERIAQGLEDSDRRRALGLTAIENGVMTADQQYAFTKAQGDAIKSGLERLRKSTADRPSSPQTTALLQKQLDRTIQAARIHAMRQIVSELR